MVLTRSQIFSITLVIFSFIHSQEIVMSLGAVTDSSAEVTMDTPFDVGGFQFDAVGASVTSASGGLAAEAGFTVSTGGETVLGFSFTGSFIPAGSSGVLTNLTGNMPADLCLSLGTGAISDTAGNALDVTFGDSDCNVIDPPPCDDVDSDDICDDGTQKLVSNPPENANTIFFIFIFPLIKLLVMIFEHASYCLLLELQHNNLSP